MPISKYTTAPVGQEFQRLTVLSYSHSRPGTKETIHYWLFRCRCGTEKPAQAKLVVLGYIESCGCYHAELRSQTKHGHAVNGKATSEYTAWAHMLQRTQNPKCAEYKDYGARGITVCERWKVAANFLQDMGPKPTPHHSLERKENNGNYDPGNCVWATRLEQNRNKRTSRHVTWQRRTQVIEDWASEMGMTPQALNRRLRRWSVARAMTTPIKRSGNWATAP